MQTHTDTHHTHSLACKTQMITPTHTYPTSTVMSGKKCVNVETELHWLNLIALITSFSPTTNITAALNEIILHKNA